MIAQDIRDQFEHFAEQAYRMRGDGTSMLVALGVPFDEIDLIFEVVLDRLEPMMAMVGDDPRGILPSLAWIDGFAIGVALERRKVTLR